MASTYEGWRNSATYLAALYLRQDSRMINTITDLMHKAPLRGETLSRVIPSVVVMNGNDDDVGGVFGGTLKIDFWAEGQVEWDEIATSFDLDFNIKPEPVSNELQQLLMEAVIVDNVVRFTRKLDRKLYLMVDDALQAIGGTRPKKAKGHEFPTDPTDLIDSIIETGTFERPRKQDNFRFFRTPPDRGEVVLKLAGIVEGWRSAGLRMLEPNAGDGAIADLAAAIVGHENIVTVELQECNAQILREKGYDPVVGDFLAYDTSERFSAVLMNPPFSKQQDIDHVMHAWKFLAPGGVSHHKSLVVTA